MHYGDLSETNGPGDTETISECVCVCFHPKKQNNMAAIPSASKTIWETFLDHVTRNASAVHNKEAWGLAKVKAKVVPGKRVAISS